MILHKKIVHITTMHDPLDTRIFRNECVSLAKNGFDVSFCVPAVKADVVDGVKIIPVPKYKSFKERVFTAPKKAIEIATKIPADIYHFHDPELFFGMSAYAKKTGKKVIWDAHENYEETISNFNSLKVKPVSWLAAKVFGKYEIASGKNNLAGVVTVTDIMANRYRKNGILTAEVGNFSNIANLAVPQFKETPQTVKFISSGFQFKERGVIEIAHAINHFKEDEKFEVSFAGKFKSDDLKNEIIAAANNSAKLALSGPHTWNELVLEKIPEAHVGFVLFDISDPNNCNGLPNRFFECWSNGLPVITTAGTEVARIVKEENGGIIIPDNTPESIYKAMKTFIDKPELVNEMGRNARRAVEEKYSWDAAFKNLLNLYNTILAKN